jgi:mono/diheme cytochrome c family protein
MSPRYAPAFGALLLTLLITLVGCGRAASSIAGDSANASRACAPGDPGYSSAVRPIVEHYCIGCHSPEGVAGDEHDFTRPELLRGQHRIVSARLRAHSMPPAASPELSGAERALIIHWAECGAELD